MSISALPVRRCGVRYHDRTATGGIAVIEEDVMHPATMQALAAQRGSDLYADAAAARRARQAHRGQLAQQHRQISPREATGVALSTKFCQTLAVTSNVDAAA
jgi:hypothetical protein